MPFSIGGRGSVLLDQCATRPCHPPPQEFRLVVLVVLLFPMIAWPLEKAALAQALHKQSQQQTLQEQRKHNDGTLMILGGHTSTTYSRLARDFAAALGGRDGLRLLAVDAGGGTEN